jgi:hypothetical protein
MFSIGLYYYICKLNPYDPKTHKNKYIRTKTTTQVYLSFISFFTSFIITKTFNAS